LTFALFQNYKISSAEVSEFQKSFCSDAVPLLLDHENIISVSLFNPIQAYDPFVEKDPKPDLIIQISVTNMSALDSIFDNTKTSDTLTTPESGSATFEIFETIAFDIPGIKYPKVRTAPVSYNIRYFPPVENEKLFRLHYLQRHPPILAEFEDIRNIFCYIPLEWSHPLGILKSGCILGNEVVFDSNESLNRSLLSDVRKRLREDFNSLPVKPGPNTHFATRRRDFFKN
jgi:hypothetical protein